MIHILQIHGKIPSKKNLLRRRKNGGMFRVRKVADRIDGITSQIAEAWGGREPMDRPALRAVFRIVDHRSDVDNKYTTVQDCLTKAGVLINDNTRHGPKPITIDWTEGEPEGVTIYLEE